MVDYTSPITATFELQRQTIQQSQQALEQGLDFQKEFNQALADGLDGQEDAQRRVVELQREAILDTLETVESTVPGAEDATGEVRTTVEQQFDQLLENHEDAFESIADGVEGGTQSYDEFVSEYLDALDDQLQMVVDAHDDFETQSVEAAESVTDRLEELQSGLEDVQQHVADAGD